MRLEQETSLRHWSEYEWRVGETKDQSIVRDSGETCTWETGRPAAGLRVMHRSARRGRQRTRATCALAVRMIDYSCV